MQGIEMDRHAPECHTWALGGQRRTGFGSTQCFTTQAFTMESNHLPGPAHTLTSVCKVQTLLCGSCAPVTVRVKKVCLHVLKYYSSCVCVHCMHARVSAWWTEQLVPEGGQPLSTGTQTCMFVCEKQSSL